MSPGIYANSDGVCGIQVDAGRVYRANRKADRVVVYQYWLYNDIFPSIQYFPDEAIEFYQ